jgi:hypothetical protein
MARERPWFTKYGDERAGVVQTMGRALAKDQAFRLERYRLNQQLFEGQHQAHAVAGDMVSAIVPDMGDVTYNSFRSLVLTAVSTVFAPQKPKPQFMTSGAEYRVRRRAQKADKFCEGILRQRHEQHLDAWSFMLQRRAESMCQGAAPVYVHCNYESKRIEMAAVPVTQLYVDPAERQNPRTLFRVYDRSSEELLEDYGDNEVRRYAIESATDIRPDSTHSVPKQDKRVEVIEWWRLGSTPDDDGDYDGQHTVVVNGVEMLKRDETHWVAQQFPFIFVQAETRLDEKQFWGMGFIESTLGLGIEGNRALGAIQRQMVVNSSRRVYYTVGSIMPEHLEANDAEVHIPVTEGAQLPNVEQPPPFHPMQLEYTREIFKLQFDQCGVSQVSAAARREPGIESAVAQRTLNDTKAGRQLWMAKSFENDFVELGHQFMARAKELRTVAGAFSVQYVGKHEIREFDYDEIALERYPFIVQVAPASALPQDYAGRLALVQEMMGSGMVSLETGKQLLAWPDLEHEVSTETAEYDYTDSLIDTYLDAEEDDWDEGDYESPEGFLVNKTRALLQMSAAYFRAKLDKAPDFNLQLLARYIGELDEQIKAAAQAAAALQGPPPGPPGLPPGAGAPPPGAGPPMLPPP